MKGFVDDGLRALLRVPVAASGDGDRNEILVWIDTAFNGGLVIPRRQIAALGFVKESSAEAILADGNLVELETFDVKRITIGNKIAGSNHRVRFRIR